jgi:hypothetical protein
MIGGASSVGYSEAESNTRPTTDKGTAMSYATDPMATVQSYADAFNKGDVKAMAALFDASGSILDGLPPTCGKAQLPAKIVQTGDGSW